MGKPTLGARRTDSVQQEPRTPVGAIRCRASRGRFQESLSVPVGSLCTESQISDGKPVATRTGAASEYRPT